MTAQERLEKSRQELDAYRQNVQQDERVDMDYYQERLGQMRYMQRNHPDFEHLDLSRDMGVGRDPVIALVMGQLNIEARIRRLEEEAAQEPQVIAVPLAQIVQPPAETPPPPEAAQAAPQQQLSRWQRVKNWFKSTFSRNREESSAGGPPEPAPEPVQVQRDCRTLIPAIETTPVRSHVRKVRRFQKANRKDPGIVTPEEMRMMQQRGARGSDGQFLAVRSAPVVTPIAEQARELFKKLEANGFDFQTALSGMKECQIAVGYVKVNEASVSMVVRGMKMWDEYLENKHVQEYITMLYQSVGDVLKRNVKEARGDDAFPTDDEFDDHIMEILPTRGLECFRNQLKDPKASQDSRDFAKECSKLMGKMAHVEKFCASCDDPDTVAMLQPMLQQYRILKQKISQIGAPMRERRLREMNSPTPPAGGAAT